MTARRDRLHRPRAVIFDMDGLMLDTERSAPRAWERRRADAPASNSTSALLPSMIGRNYRDSRALHRRAHYGDDYPTDRSSSQRGTSPTTRSSRATASR